MAIPLAIAGPAALIAGAAWIDAKTQFSYDLKLIRGLAAAYWKTLFRERCDRINLFYDLEQHAKGAGTANNPFLLYEGKQWTFKEAYDTVLKYGTWLKTKYSIVPGEVVAIDFMNSPQYVFMWLGIWSLGATPAFINYNLSGDALLHCVTISTARILFADEDVKPRFTQDIMDKLASSTARDGKRPIQTVFFNSNLEQTILSIKGVREPDSSRSVLRLNMAVLIFTSGTTGLPKAAFVSWQKIFLLIGFVPTWLGLKRSDRLYTCMPLYHSSASLLACCTSLVIGNTLALGHRYSTSTFWHEVRQHNATIIQYVGETCRYLLATPPQHDPITGTNLDRANSVRIAFGNGLRPDVWERFKERFGIQTIAEFYGATEGVSATWNASSNAFSSGAIGRNGALTRLIVKRQTAIVAVDWTTESPLRDPQKHNFCQRVKTDEPGELLFKLDPANTHSKFQGYFNNESATDGKILRDVFAKRDTYCRSGDVVRWDSEGRWWFCDRIGDTFRWKSENVSTAEVSGVLGTHPNIHEANVYGVEIPNHDGRAGCAAVLFDTEEVGERLLESVAKHAVGNLPKYAVPIFLRVVREHKTTGNNKQQKAVLRNDGVEPGKVQGDQVIWLKGGKYVHFSDEDWEDLRLGRVKF